MSSSSLSAVRGPDRRLDDQRAPQGLCCPGGLPPTPLGGPLKSRPSRVFRDKNGYAYAICARPQPSLSHELLSLPCNVTTVFSVSALHELSPILEELRAPGISRVERSDVLAVHFGCGPIALQATDRLVNELVRARGSGEQRRRARPSVTRESAADAWRLHVPADLTTLLVGEAADPVPAIEQAGYSVEAVPE